MRRADYEPGQAARFAAAVAARARREGDLAAASLAERASGRASLQTGHADNAIRHLRSAIALAEQVGSIELAGEARIPLSAALVQRGLPQEALREIDIAIRDLRGPGVARARGQRADLLRQIGSMAPGLAEFEVAIPLLRASGDLVHLQRTLVNRGILHTELHRFAAAEADLLEADQLARQLGRHLAVGIIAENLGYLETLRGNVPAALAHLSRAEHVIGALRGQLGPVYMDQSELLLSAGLRTEALESAQRAIRAFERHRRRLMVPGARLFLAQAALLGGDVPVALDQARRARREFSRQHRPAWAALAQLIALRAELASPAGTRLRLAELTALVRTLEDAGWPAAAVEARLAAAQVSAYRGRPEHRRAHLKSARATARRAGPAVLRARGWYAEALLRLDRGDTRGAAAAARTGLRTLDEHAAALGATDLRARSAAHRAELSELGVRMAVAANRPVAVFEWAERGRANRLMRRSVLPEDDPVLADLLAQLRATTVEIDRGESRSPHRQVVLERRIRDHCRLHPTRSTDGTTEPVQAGVVGEALGDRALVVFVQVDGVLRAVTLVDGRLRLHVLGPTVHPADLVERLPFALRRLGRSAVSAAGRAAAADLLAHAARGLDAALLRPLPEVADRPLVVVPTGVLHDVPWSVLPSCVGRPVTVSPSATLWHTASTQPAPEPRNVTVAAGPALAGARAEAAAVAAIHRCVPLVDGDATVGRILAALPTAGVAHLAAHGTLSVDNPLFSTLRLHDGPLLAYDLERLPAVPHTVVLASCDTGRSVVCTGDELLGLSSTFIARGTAQLVAPVVPVPDLETTPLMVALHRRIAEGQPAAVALAEAQRTMSESDPRDLAAAAAFVCIGGERSA